jgi:pilus assembly protein TadC
VWLYLILWLALLTAAYLLVLRWAARRQIAGRLDSGPVERESVGVQPEGRSWLGRRLSLAGFRGRHSTRLFLLSIVLSVTLGVVVVHHLRRNDLLRGGRDWLTQTPGGAGQIIEPVLAAIPWAAGILLALFPVLWLRSRRRERVRRIEEDLPITLELLAAQARAGLGLEAGLSQLLKGGDRRRPLPQELTIFQNETLAGVPHVRALRRFADRADVPSVDVFVTALIHAEQVGGGLSNTLRFQADELRSRRRERAFAIAQGLPARVMVPLVVCFLPGIFVWTLGPAMHQFIQLIEQVLRTTSQR